MAHNYIEHLAPCDLRPWARNARTHSKKQLKQLAESIRTFGFTNPVLIDQTNTILAGHGRVEDAKCSATLILIVALHQDLRVANCSLQSHRTHDRGREAGVCDCR